MRGSLPQSPAPAGPSPSRCPRRVFNCREAAIDTDEPSEGQSAALESPPPTLCSSNCFAPAQAVQNGLGSTYPYLNSSLVVSAKTACTDVGTGLTLPPAFILKAPYPQAGASYAGSTIAGSLVSTVAAYVLSVGGLASAAAAFNRTAASQGFSPTYPGGDVST